VATFPLSVSANGRYLQDATGTPFFLHGDTCWSIEVQLTNAEIDTYLANRAAKGVNAILFEAIEHRFSSQTPEYENVDGDQPFTSMTDFASSLVSAYWNRVDYIVNQALSYGMVCIMNPAYVGFSGGSEGWMSEINAESDADLQTYGATLATRYTQGNVIWCLGGDYNGTVGERNKQWNIVTGIRSVRTTDLITAHSDSSDGAYAFWNGYTGFNFNNAYPGTAEVAAACLAEYARSGPMPFIMLEALYEQERSPVISAAGLRRQSYQALLSGACGQFFGNNPIWHFEAPTAPFTWTGTWQTELDSTGSVQQQYVKSLFISKEWWKLVPKSDASLVSSALSSGDTKVCPALASDNSFGMVWIPTSQTVTVVMSNFPSTVTARLYDPTNGTYSTVGTFSNVGSQNIASGGERVLLLETSSGQQPLRSQVLL
jgi:hypothetical protein